MKYPPRLATIALVLANCAVFAWCVYASGGVNQPFSARLLLSLGAISNDTLAKHEYWRLIACAFLHGGALHLLFNMFCLIAWGGALEDRIGAPSFFAVYLLAAIGGSIASILGHNDPFYGVGASGAISGLLGALLCLAFMRKFPADVSFFVTNIGLNVVVVSQSADIDWIAHLGGLIAGLVAMGFIALIQQAFRQPQA